MQGKDGPMMHNMTLKRGSMHHVQIVDGEKLRGVLEVLRERYGSDRKAARQLGINQSTFLRLRTGTTSRTMAFSTFARISGVFGVVANPYGRPRHELTEFAVRPTNDEVKERAERIREARGRADEIGLREMEEAREILWKEGEARAAADLELYERFRDAILREDERHVQTHYENWLDTELRRLKPKAEPVLEALWKNGYRADQIKSFLRRVGRKGDRPTADDKRCWLALYRAVEPLSDAGATWGVERTGEELEEAKERREFLRASLKREEIMLKREPDMDRVRKARPPRSAKEEREWWAARDHFFEDHPEATEEDWDSIPE